MAINWYEERKEICNKMCPFHGCGLQRLKGKCRLRRLARPMYCCPHERFLPVVISEIKVAQPLITQRLIKCSKCNYNANGYCQAPRGCGFDPIQSPETSIILFSQFEEMLPFRGCKHPRRKVGHRPPYGWLQ